MDEENGMKISKQYLSRLVLKAHKCINYNNFKMPVILNTMGIQSYSDKIIGMIVMNFKQTIDDFIG